MGIASEFKEFAMKGSVVDLAVGVVIGGAFGKIVNSLVGDVIMPPIGLAIGGVNFSDLAVQIGTNPKGAPVLFMVIKAINRLKRPVPAPPPPPPSLTKTEELLQEIRDQLAKR